MGDDTTILVIEDEKDIRKLILFNLRKDGHTAWGAADGEEGLRLFKEKKPVLVVLDLMLPGMDGMAVCRKIRNLPERADTPILMLTARTSEEDIVAGLETGADDYVAKPFSNRVLLARVRTLLRRTVAVPGETKRLVVGDIVLTPEKMEATVSGKRIVLTAGEYATLHVLMRRPGIVFSRSQLLDLVRGDLHAVTERAVDVQIVGLRRKLGRVASLLETVRGAGYRIRNPLESDA